MQAHKRTPSLSLNLQPGTRIASLLALLQAARVPQRTPQPHAARPSWGRPARVAASGGPAGRAPVIVSPWQMNSVSSRYSTVCFQCVVRHLRAAQP